MGGGEGAFPAGEEATRGENELTAQAQHSVPPCSAQSYVTSN